MRQPSAHLLLLRVVVGTCRAMPHAISGKLPAHSSNMGHHQKEGQLQDNPSAAFLLYSVAARTKRIWSNASRPWQVFLRKWLLLLLPLPTVLPLCRHHADFATAAVATVPLLLVLLFSFPFLNVGCCSFCRRSYLLMVVDMLQRLEP